MNKSHCIVMLFFCLCSFRFFFSHGGARLPHSLLLYAKEGQSVSKDMNINKITAFTMNKEDCNA